MSATRQESAQLEQSPQQRDLKMLTLNISGPSVERAKQLTTFLLSLDVDVFVLTETRANKGTELLLTQFETEGYGIQAALPSCKRERGVAVLSRMESRSVDVHPATVDLPHRLAVADVCGPGELRLLATYVPSRDATVEKIHRKRRFLDQLIQVVEQEALGERLVLMGDLNVVSRAHRPRYPAFRSWEYDALEQVEGHGLVDSFSELYPDVQAHSWIGRTGNGYRYDYAFVSRALVDAVRGCEYMHEPRLRGLSDHAALMLSLCSDSLVAGAESRIKLAAA